MDRNETLTLFAEGREAWNAWAQEMRDARRALIDAGEWTESPDPGARTDARRDWHAAARADFREHRFDDTADFRSFEFPGNTQFENVTFDGAALFDGATFEGSTEFDNATFKALVVFDGATFRGEGAFESATFEGVAAFVGATFQGWAIFDSATLDALAVFDGATFEDSAGFDLVRFNGLTTLTGTKFKSTASFQAMRGESAFSLARAVFDVLPDFEQAHFEEAPRLDNLRIEPRRCKSGILGVVKTACTSPARILGRRPAIRRLARRGFSACRTRFAALWRRIAQPDPDRPARWRSLKRLAVQAHDHAREQDFFKGEMIDRRFVEDRPWHAVFWAGLVYQVLSDFGRSIFRPLVWLALATVAFAALYLEVHDGQSTASGTATAASSCIAGPAEMTPRSAALQLSLRRALILPGIGGGETLNPIYACLYGIDSRRPQPAGKLVPPYRPRVPAAVGYLGLLQGVVSAVLLFLLLLAIRNHFRIQ